MNARQNRLCLVALLATVSCTVALSVWWRTVLQVSSRAPDEGDTNCPSQLIALSNPTSSELDIARRNLLCAADLPGSAGDALSSQLTTLDDWARRIALETTRHWHRYRQNPTEFNHSQGFFRMLMMAVVLSEDFNIKYDPGLRTSPGNASSHDGFFASADSVFLSGLLGPARKGTCSSLPVLYVALGRRLGYPLHLVTTKGHLFVRWDGQGERFNVEATGHGLNTFDDDYYRKWPFPITAEDESAEGYLRNLDAAGELAVFLSIRAMCLRENGRVNEAAEAFAKAAQLAPHCNTYAMMHAELDREAQRPRADLGLTISKGTSP